MKYSSYLSCLIFAFVATACLALWCGDKIYKRNTPASTPQTFIPAVSQNAPVAPVLTPTIDKIGLQVFKFESRKHSLLTPEDHKLGYVFSQGGWSWWVAASNVVEISDSIGSTNYQEYILENGRLYNLSSQPAEMVR